MTAVSVYCANVLASFCKHHQVRHLHVLASSCSCYSPSSASAPVNDRESLTCIFPAAEAKPEVVEAPKLARVPLPSGALAAVAAQLKQYTSAREQHLLAVADKAATAASPVATEDMLAQQWQVRARLLLCTMLFSVVQVDLQGRLICPFPDFCKMYTECGSDAVLRCRL